MPSSVSSPARGASSAANIPFLVARAALSWLDRANSSSWARVSPHLAAMSSALMPCGTSPSGYRSVNATPPRSAEPATLAPIGMRPIDSTPAATTTS
ncbi:Uncharacterised protein [Mycobacteroides abscessus subsp. abscessus]|nr:Uncharacterised protein [Mycobacteroides abscessus subsp. abscessus]